MTITQIFGSLFLTYLHFHLSFIRPTNEIVRLLLTRSASSLNSSANLTIPTSANSTAATADDLLSVTTLHYWGRPGGAHAQRFAEILSSMVTSAVNALRGANDADDGSGSSSSGRKRNGPK